MLTNVSVFYYFLLIGSESTWSPHSVELALWTHYVASELKPELLSSVPDAPKKQNSEQTKTDTHINGNVNQTTKVFITKENCRLYFIIFNLFLNIVG